MSIESSTYSGGMRVTNYSTEKLLMFNNSFASANYTNPDAYPVDIPVGTVFGRISSSGEVVPLVSTANDGSQFPIGVLPYNLTVEDGETAEIRLVTGGEINANMLVFANGTDTLDTIVSSRHLRDRLAADTVGLILQFPDELSKFDNQ